MKPAIFRKLGLWRTFDGRFKSTVAKISLFVLGRALQSGSRHASGIEREIAVWPEGFVVVLDVLPRGPRMVIKKGKKWFHYGGSGETAADLAIHFKNLECAYMVLIPKIGPVQAFVEHRMTVEGDLANAVIFTRCLNKLLAYLYPAFICRRLLKSVPPMTINRQLTRLAIYAGILLGA